MTVVALFFFSRINSQKGGLCRKVSQSLFHEDDVGGSLKTCWSPFRKATGVNRAIDDRYERAGGWICDPAGMMRMNNCITLPYGFSLFHRCRRVIGLLSSFELGSKELVLSSHSFRPLPVHKRLLVTLSLHLGQAYVLWPHTGLLIQATQ